MFGFWQLFKLSSLHNKVKYKKSLKLIFTPQTRAGVYDEVAETDLEIESNETDEETLNGTFILRYSENHEPQLVEIKDSYYKTVVERVKRAIFHFHV